MNVKEETVCFKNVFLSFCKLISEQLLKNEEYLYRLGNGEQMVFYRFAAILKSIEVVRKIENKSMTTEYQLQH